jgi:uncharacterized protein (TIRG00374 family)
LRKVDWSALSAVLTRLHPGWALAGWALTSLLIVGLALRWQIFLREQKIELPFATILSLTWAGQFFNSFLPGSTGGDVVKVYQLCRLVPDRKAAAAATVFVDRLSAFLALLVLAVIAMTIDPVPLRLLSAQSLSLRTLSWILFLGIAALAGAALLFRTLRSTFWGGRLVRTLVAAKNNLSFNRRLLAAVFLAFAIHLINFFIAYLFARALGISITYLQVLVIVPVVIFLLMLPVTINGHGLRELLLISYFTHMGITLSGHPESGAREIAIAWSFLLVTNDLLWSIPGGIWYLARFKTPLRVPEDVSENALK